MNIFILIFSILIYASFGIYNLIYILLSTLISFFSAKTLKKSKRKKLILIVIILNILLLLFFKLYIYNNFFGIFEKTSIIVPIGISYYTFQIISYLIDVYNEKIDAETNLFNFLLYALYLPYLFIGPISRYSQLGNQLKKKKKIKLENFIYGFMRILFGLFKKVIIAQRIIVIINYIVENNFTGSYVLLSCLLYSILIYCDFSGGIDIVLGVSNLFDIKLVENFDSPYLSENLKEFWKRWNITLSNFLKDYVYIPLGGNRVSKIRNNINILITFFVSGIWHGINYILWGLLNGIILIIENNKKSKNRILNIIFNYIIVSLLWIFFIYPNSIEALTKLSTIFYEFNYISLFKNLFIFGLEISDYLILIISIVIIMIFDIKKLRIKEEIKKMTTNKKIIIILILFLLVITFGRYGIGFNVNEFIYSKF